MTATAAIVISLLASAPGAEAGTASSPSGDAVKARELVVLLGDSKFRVRDAAEKELVHLGLASLEALKEGEKSPDLHVRERCLALQPTIRALTLQRRIDQFVQSGPNSSLKDLPFLDSFVKIAGDAKEARELYGDMLLFHSEMLDELARDGKKGKAGFLNFCREITNRVRYQPGLDYRALQQSIRQADVMVYLLLGREFANDKNGQIANAGYTFLNAPIMAETLAKNDLKALPFRKVFLAWLEKEPQPHMVQHGLQVAVNAKMPEVLPLVLKLIKDKSVPIHTRVQTALMLGSVGTRENLKEIVPLLEDKTLIGGFNINNKKGQVQMRDVALAVCIKLTGQKIADYDFDVLPGNEDFFFTSYIYCAFSSDEKREAVHRKFKESQEKEAKK